MTTNTTFFKKKKVLAFSVALREKRTRLYIPILIKRRFVSNPHVCISVSCACCGSAKDKG